MSDKKNKEEMAEVIPFSGSNRPVANVSEELPLVSHSANGPRLFRLQLLQKDKAVGTYVKMLLSESEELLKNNFKKTG